MYIVFTIINIFFAMKENAYLSIIFLNFIFFAKIVIAIYICFNHDDATNMLKSFAINIFLQNSLSSVFSTGDYIYDH